MQIVFSDLDGTLLDHHSYSYDAALPGIAALHENNIPLVLISSKTCNEMVLLHKELKLESPFIFENGGGIAIPDKANNSKLQKIYNGKQISDLQPQIQLVENILQLKIKTLIDMTIDEVIATTGLS